LGGLGGRQGSLTSRTRALAGMPLTFVLVLVTWVFFRAPSFSEAWTVLSAMAGMREGTATPMTFRLYESAIVTCGAVLVAAEPVLVGMAERNGIGWWWRVPYWLRGAAYASMTLVIVAFGGVTQKFIYFDF